MPDGSYAVWAGTSVSAPLVSGQAALILSEVPGIKQDHVVQAIEQTANQLPQNPIQSGAINIVSGLAFALMPQQVTLVRRKPLQRTLGSVTAVPSLAWTTIVGNYDEKADQDSYVGNGVSAPGPGAW